VNEKYRLAIIGPSVSARNPKAHGEMNAYAHHVSRSLKRDSRLLEALP